MATNVISLKPSREMVVNRSRVLLFPLIGILCFLMMWHLAAKQVETSLGTLPGPVQTFEQFKNLAAEHVEERDKALAFVERQEKRNAAKLAKNPDAKVKIRLIRGNRLSLTKLALH
ncbi:nitrate ABC transporter permease protein [Vibrio maritimus]|uniref:Nitrate ABC transporter permease protein n=1 Tax=Vibrio maritimus TaxID=990268 RepID=A0A090TEV3_9VIBR|nr:nitrate ABC transporter permease protein [Vibrio maritimus]